MTAAVAPILKALYYRTKSLFADDVVTYRLRGDEVQFRATSYREFRRFQSLMGEEDVLDDLLEHLRPGDVFFDVGANVGTYSCFVAQELEGGTVVAFEPEPTNADRLLENVALNDLDVDLHRVALAEVEGAAHLAIDESAPGSGRHALTDEPGGGSIGVTQAVADRLVEDGEVPVPNVLKIDVEGAEMKVLAGFAETLSHEACRLVYCEVHPAELRTFGHTVEELQSFLENRGFDPVILKEMGDKFFLRAECSDDE